MSFIRLYLYLRYEKSIKFLNRLIKYINVYKPSIILLFHLFNYQD